MSKLKRPNVLIIYTDQQRTDTLSCYSATAVNTKNIDSIAHDGALLSSCYSQSPICGPSRMSFLTGRYCSAIGVGTNGIEFPSESCVPINQILKCYGYETAQIGKLHFQAHAKRDHRNPFLTYGFDRAIISDEPGCYDDAYTKWVESIEPQELPKVRTMLPPAAIHYNKTGYSDNPRNTHEPYIFEGNSELTHSAFVADELCNFISQRQKNKPFFAIAGFYAPHPPINPPKECLDRVDESKIKLPIRVSIQETMPYLRDISDSDWKKIIKYYLALTLHVDDCVGRILDCLKQENIYDDTLIIFTSDHGEFLGDYGKIQKGMPGNRCITNIPMIIKYTGKIKPQLLIDSMAECVDIVPTILDFCGVQTPQYVQGKILFNLLCGKTVQHKHTVLTEYFEPYGIRENCIRTKEYMYYINSKGEELMFDLKNDIDEVNNIAYDVNYKDILSDMRKRMILKIQKAAYLNLKQEAEY